jgi:hypothetical protein
MDEGICHIYLSLFQHQGSGCITTAAAIIRHGVDVFFEYAESKFIWRSFFVGASKIFLAGCHRYLGTPALPAQELDFVNYHHCCPAFIYWVAN